ncbi:AAA domain-containing protein [Myxozyma melibiosi]|uniref:AAA domain-containing protein n=1 Tax=Myxozyma melibiosi TaxID=54550 RepID=A0ABR1F3J9_9ASCO
MSSIQKLSIQGIRSFDQTEREVIHFYTPLTLIVGHNGSGKTTIIECLRYATTGDLPPNNKGGAFIHDPKIAGEKEVMAQVKLGFTSTSGVPMICTRSMQLTMKKTTRTFKTLEGQLLVTQDGKRTTISTRCAELDAQMPQYLGVSKAILDYVVFCHQDDSLWPLSEPATLKKRFDEIFEALKFTKALDAIRALRKERATEIKILTNDVAHFKVDKDRADKLRTRIETYQRDIESLTEQARALNQSMDKNTAEIAALFKSNQGFQKVLSDLSEKRNTLISLKEQVIRLEQTIEAMDESTEELEDRLSSFESHVQKQQDDLEILEEKIRKTRADVEIARQKHTDALGLEGRYHAAADSHEKLKRQRDELIKTISRSCSISGFNTFEFDDDQVARFLEQLKETTRQLSETVARVVKEGEFEEEKARGQLEGARREKSSAEMQISLNEKTARTRDEEKARLQTQIDAISADESALLLAKAAVESAKAKLEEAKTALENKNFGELIAAKTSELRGVEMELEDVTNELTVANRQSQVRAKMTLLVDEAEKHSQTMSTLTEVHGPRFLELTGSSLERVSAPEAEGALKTAVENAQKKLAKAREERTQAQDELSRVETKCSIAKQDILTKGERAEADLDKYERMFETRDISIYEEELEDLEDDLDNKKQKLARSEFAISYFEAAVKYARSNKKCSLCNRELCSDDEEERDDLTVSELVGVIETQIDSFKELLKGKELEEESARLDRARALAPQVASIREFRKQLPGLEEKFKELEMQLKESNEKVSVCDGKVTEAKQKLDELEMLRKPISDLVRATREREEAHAAMDTYTQQLPGNGEPYMRALETIERDRRELSDRAAGMRKEQQRLADERELARSQISILDNEVRDARMRLSAREHEVQTKSSYAGRMQDVVRERDAAVQGVEQLKVKIAGVENSIREFAGQLRETQAHYQQQIEAASAEERNVRRQLTQFESVQRDVEQYVMDNVAGKLAKSIERVQKYEARVQQLTADQEEYLRQRNGCERELANVNSQKRRIADNIQLRELRARVSAQEEQIRKLEALDAEREKDAYEDKSKKLQMRQTKLTAEYGKKVGELSQLNDQVKEGQRELRTEFLNVDRLYRENLIRLKVTTTASEDLGKYSKAVEGAIMKYHSLKMEEINRIIDELWKKTYSGTDVDTILIRSDDESGKGNRSYNYRVCMVKQDVELDMRGRCSAGQKVLASIIIRLALAECFGVNCGIIALDEPTTNLDQENVQALARSLGSIIAARKRQKNFQLIIITHDEEFLRYMNGSQHCEYYFRVSRNERQKSQIERQRMSEVF